MNKKTVALSEAEYRECIMLLRNGFKLSGVFVKPNPVYQQFVCWRQHWD